MSHDIINAALLGLAERGIKEGRMSVEEAEGLYGIKIPRPEESSKENGFYIKGKKQPEPDYYGWAKYYIEKNKFFSFDGGYYIYDDKRKHYRRISELEIDYHLTQDTMSKAQPIHRAGFLRTLAASSFKLPSEMQRTKEMLNLQNGVLNIRTKELSQNDGSLFFTYCLPHTYDPSAKCDKWIKFLNEVFKGSDEMKAIAAQIFGYIMLGGHPWLHKAFVLYGEGRNGKSTFLEILKELIGLHNFTTVSLSDLDKAFSRVRLDDTLANIIEETPNDKINAEIFKTAVGGGHLLGAEKYKDEYTFQCNARFIFACNELPKFSESSVGLQERLYFIPFNTYFEKDKRNGNILKELLEELPGVLNWALSGLDMLLEQRYIPDCDSSQKIFEQYQAEADSVYSWANDSIDINEKADFITTHQLYNYYRGALKDSGRRAVSDMTFYKRFKKFMREKHPQIVEERRKGEGPRGYKSISLTLSALSF